MKAAVEGIEHLGTLGEVLDNPRPAETDDAVAADGKVFALYREARGTNETRFQMLRASSKKYELLAETDLGVVLRTSPCYAGRKLYLRCKDGVACFDLTRTGARAKGPGGKEWSAAVSDLQSLLNVKWRVDPPPCRIHRPS
jgi:hypothetical protein